MEAKLELPKLIEVNDYHQFDTYVSILNNLGVPVRCEEIGFGERSHFGVLFLSGEGRPSLTEIHDLMYAEYEDYEAWMDIYI